MKRKLLEKYTKNQLREAAENLGVKKTEKMIKPVLLEALMKYSYNRLLAALPERGY